MGSTKFDLGILVLAGEVTRRCDNKDFDKFVNNSVRRYSQCDWGDISDKHKILNNHAIKYNDEMVSAIYKYDDSAAIRIYTDKDKLCTTVIFLENYLSLFRRCS